MGLLAKCQSKQGCQGHNYRISSTKITLKPQTRISSCTLASKRSREKKNKSAWPGSIFGLVSCSAAAHETVHWLNAINVWDKADDAVLEYYIDIRDARVCVREQDMQRVEEDADIQNFL